MVLITSLIKDHQPHSFLESLQSMFIILILNAKLNIVLFSSSNLFAIQIKVEHVLLRITMTQVRGCWQQPSQGDTELLEAAHTRFSQLYQVKIFLFQWKTRWIQKTEMMTKTSTPSLGADVFLKNFCSRGKDISR